MWRLHDRLRGGEQRSPARLRKRRRRTGITWMRVYQISNGAPFPDSKAAFVPILCQQCGNETPCAAVCPQEAVEVDPATGIVDQMPQRCLGCRYCMAACPYHARYFNWWDPQWPPGLEKTLNPDVATRMRGVVEKCNFCHGRLHAARAHAAAEGRRDLHPGEYVPACAEACPAGAIVFGDLNDPASEVARLAHEATPSAFSKSSAPTPRSTTAPLALGPPDAAAQPAPRKDLAMPNVDIQLMPRGVRAAPRRAIFCFGSLPWSALLAFGLYGAGLCLVKGLNQTNMDNRFAFGLWIFLDLTVIALGAGAFFTGFLLYILKKSELKAVINSAVVIGFICYSGAVAALLVDVGQPLRFWFTFWHPNVHSMLTEVTFCISCYLTVLFIEYMPIVLKNRKLSQVPSFLVFEFELHKLMPVLAGVGTFLSFFHQGSLGGLYGVLRGRPFAFREGFAIWPSTFFLFILSAAAAGPAFILLTTWLVSKISGKQLVRPGCLTAAGPDLRPSVVPYILLKSIDTLVWIDQHFARRAVSPPHQFYALEAVRRLDPVCRNLVFGLVAGADPAAPPPAGTHRLAGLRRGSGLSRDRAQPLRA